MNVIHVTTLGLDVPLRHLADCARPKVGVFQGTRGDYLARCNTCAERRVVTPHELAEIHRELEARETVAAPKAAPIRSRWRCREHPDQPVTPKGKGCRFCAAERNNRNRNRNERTPA